jgi:hypothetical protein
MSGGKSVCGAIVNKLVDVVGKGRRPGAALDCALEVSKFDEAERMFDEEAMRLGSLHTEVGDATRAISGICCKSRCLEKGSGSASNFSFKSLYKLMSSIFCLCYLTITFDSSFLLLSLKFIL